MLATHCRGSFPSIVSHHRNGFQPCSGPSLRCKSYSSSIGRGTVGGQNCKLVCIAQHRRSLRHSLTPKVVCLASGDKSLPLKILSRVRTTLNKLYCTLLPGPAQFLSTFLLPLSVSIAAVGAAYGDVIWLYVKDLFSAVVYRVTFLQFMTALLQYDFYNILVPVLLSLSGGIFAFLVMPILDLLLGDDQAAGKQLNAKAYRLVLHTYTAFHLLLLLGTCWLISVHPLHPLAFIGVILSMACEGGLVFTAAHELLHSRSVVDRVLANVLLSTMCYMHWSMSHLAHHNKVATYDDPASARLNEPLYKFLPRSVTGNLVDGIEMEAARLRSSRLKLLSIHNRMFLWLSAPVGLATAIYACFGCSGLLLFLGQAVGGIIMLEVVNYVEHYGLTRTMLPCGRYEKVGTAHSWNSNSLFTNSVIFRLQRHTDHHMNANKTYELLQDIPEAPQLPWSYPVMMMLALVPPLYFRIMNRLVDEAQVQSTQQRQAD